MVIEWGGLTSDLIFSISLIQCCGGLGYEVRCLHSGDNTDRVASNMSEVLANDFQKHVHGRS